MLYQKVRPACLDEFVGNVDAVLGLRNVLKQDEKPHSYLISGPSGCGKTTLARILAKELECHVVDIIEKNAADVRGIDMVRELIEMSRYLPLGGKNRLVILDEAHMLTREAQNSLLKILEDTPDYQYFCLCSTEPERLLNTILTRCMHVRLGHLSPMELVEVMLQACERGDIPIPSDVVLTEIVRRSDGSPRRALVLLEQQIGLNEQESLKVVRSAAIDKNELAGLGTDILHKDWRAVSGKLKEIDEGALVSVWRGLMDYFSACLLGCVDKKGEVYARVLEELGKWNEKTGKAGLMAIIWKLCLGSFV